LLWFGLCKPLFCLRDETSHVSYPGGQMHMTQWSSFPTSSLFTEYLNQELLSIL
jgi:hypothetical protein